MKKSYLLGAVCALSLAFPLSLQASTVWTDWMTATLGDSSTGSASGTLGGVTISYTGEVTGSYIGGGPSSYWQPESSFMGGVVDTSPLAAGDIILTGATDVTGTISFSAPVVDPVIAIWSLGSSEIDSFTFAETPTLVAGGPQITFGGQSITVSGNTVTGQEGYGVVLFEGLFNSINFTSTAEYLGYYGFTVGSVQAVPIPAAVWLFGSGLLGLIGMARRKKSA